MAVFPHGSARGGSRSDGPQQIKDLRADDFYDDSHDGNDGSRGSHDTTRNTCTYTLPTFAEATDASEAMRERRADRNKSIAMRVLAAVLILTALGIGMFPRVLQYRSARELASTSARSEKRVAGWPYPQADEAFAAAREYNKRLAKSGQPVIGEAKDPLAELYDDPQNAANNASADGSDNSGDSASAKDTEYQSLLDSGDGVMGAIRIPKISVNLPVYHGTSELTLASGAGHLYGSSLPVGSTPKPPSASSDSRPAASTSCSAKRRPPRQTRRADRLARSFFIMPASVPPSRAGKRHLSDKSGRIGRFPR